MHSRFRFYIQPVRLSAQRSYQVRIGLEGDNTVEYVPAYRSVLGSLLHLPVSHGDMESANLEMQLLEEFVSECEGPLGAGAEFSVGPSSAD